MKRNKIILIMVMCLMQVFNKVSAADIITISDFRMTIGETKEFSISLNNDVTYAAFQFDLLLPDGMTIESCSANSSRIPESTTLSMSKISDGSYRFISAAIDSEPMIGSSGSIITISVKASETITSGSKTAYFRHIKLSKVDGTGTTYAEMTTPVTILEPSIVTIKSYSRTYGEENPTFEYTVNGGELDGVPVISCVATPTSTVGSYAITGQKGTVTNYNVTFVNGTLTVGKAPLKITAKDYTIKQGKALPTFEATYEGFKNSETENILTKKPTITTTATPTSALGVYDITVSGAEAQNYDISYVKGKLTIVDADALLITAKSYTIEYGDNIPAFEYTSEGATLEGTPSITCEATKTSPVGTYPIVITKGTVKNFNDTYVNGTLTIKKAPLKITAKDYTIKQGEALPTFEASYEGFKNDETSEVLTKQPVITTTATSESAPGEYDITVSGAEAQNYEISYVNGKLTIEESAYPCGYAIFDSSTGTLTFKYGVKPAGSNVYETENTGDNPAWDRSNLKIVIFDASYAQARPKSTARWFSILPNDGHYIVGLSKLEKIQGLEYLNTSKVVSMHNMFKDCEMLTSLDLSHFDTSNVLDMSGMFTYCAKLKNLDLSSFNTSSVTTMKYLFSDCKSLSNLNISSFNTEKVTDMSHMFGGLSQISTLDVSHLDTRNVTNMSGMFSGLKQVSTLDLSHLDTRNVTNMSGMFLDCHRLKTIDLSHFDTRNVTSMSHMFSFCTDLTTLDLSTFNTQNLKTMNQMFSICDNLKTLDISSFNTAKVEDMYLAFQSCLNLTTIYVGEGWTIEKVTIDERMFANCFNLVGGNGTKFDANHVDKTYAHIDEGAVNPGYFTDVKAICPVVITAKDYTIEYGDDIPAFEYTCEGAELQGTPAITCEATKMSSVGIYPIVITKGTITNFNDTYVNGTLTIKKAPLKITAKDYTIKKGESLPTFEVSYEGFKNDETSVVLTKQPVITTIATSESAPGEYDITVSDAEAQNYEITYVKGKLTITAAFIPGDVNGDGLVNVTDIVATVNYIMEKPSSNFNEAAADLNGDGYINVTDIVKMVSIIMSGDN